MAIWGAAATDAFIAVGIVGEVLFGMWNNRIQTELRKRSNDRLTDVEVENGFLGVQAAQALERAAKADLARIELEKQLAPRALTKEQFEVLQTLRGKVSAVCITAMSDVEALRFASQISDALTAAGINVQDCDQRIGLVWTELFIAVPEQELADWRKQPLYAAFRAAGLSVGCGPRSKTPMADLPQDIPIIMVGQKKPLYASPPDTDTLRILRPLAEPLAE